ncbi:transcription factor MYB63-like isoform X2 [Camellia sinensis]|uniref:Uncharacterized protein n=1 Tax=Camellia sinensis var. sinensis TaxID=542762 RepID=A0A4S4E0X9_CAMSN|nr:transcription factor MYB63-like isoform X1 [Camellia sinensis]XP_028081751.1 transcription factor MYB63-like isoform X2 [Camellia sinensis]THG08766.1 hypothetical protein TEA_020773 [Camellia sinensis var. sinensis]
MGRGRAPCCDKSKVKKGPWSPAEDFRLLTFIHNHGHTNWRSLPKLAGLLRCGKSCRLRWINYLRPDLKRGNFTKEEEETIIKLHQSLGNKWSKIASYLPGRTDNEIKNVWNTHLKKRLIKKDADDDHKNSRGSCSSPSSSSSYSSSSSSSNLRPHTHYESHQVCNMEKEVLLSAKNQDISSITTSSSASDCAGPKEAISTSSSSNCSHQVDKAAVVVYDEVNKQKMSLNSDDHQQEVIEIPMEESDIDFWDMLDNLESNESQPQEFEFEASHNSQDSNLFGEDLDDHDHDPNRGIGIEWLRYLENELGLEDDDQCNNIIAAKYNDEVGQLGSSTTSLADHHQVMLMRPEIDQFFGI